MADVENVIIIGSGPAGYTAALYTARANLSPLVIEGFMWGGLLQQTTDVENYPGYPEGVMGPEMMQQFRDQAERFGTRFITENATKVEFGAEGEPHTVWVEDEAYKARAVILAMGAEHKKLGVPGEEELGGRGVSYCATCDAAFFKERTTIIVGGGDSAMEEAIFLAKFSSKVTIVHRRDEFRASKIMLERARAIDNIHWKTPYVVEEFVPGEELSLLALCDGKRAVALAPARDYKRIGDGDTGPNTGGMGCYSPVAGADDMAREVIAMVHQPVLEELARRGTPFHGVLYAGLMLGEYGAKVLEFNVRFGDPETQVVLPRLRSDLLELLLAATEPGGLAGAVPEWDDRAAVCVVLASRGYPESSSSGDVITGLDQVPADVEVFHAGTAERDGELVTAGGRVLGVTALGPDRAAARSAAYAAADVIRFDGAQLRRDIAA
jgi:thioredoxin reductase